MIDIVKRAKEEYDVVLIDCADLRSFRDPVVVSSYVDGVVIVVNEGKTRRHVVKTAIAPLIEKKVSILGVILNNRTFAIPRMIYERV
jgi:Mrp family chromosome partitioning ATPase